MVWITHSSSLNKLLNWILLIKYCMNISDGILNWTICWLDYIAHAYMCGRGCRRKKTKSVPSVAKILFANVRPKIIPPQCFELLKHRCFKNVKTLGLRFWLDFLSKEDSCPLIKSKRNWSIWKDWFLKRHSIKILAIIFFSLEYWNIKTMAILTCYIPQNIKLLKF